MQRIKHLIISSVMALMMGVGLVPALATHAFAQTAQQQACQAINGNTGCTSPAGSPDISSIIKTVINILSIVVGVAAIIMIIIGGLRYVTSGGDASSTASAKNTIIYALVGLVVAVFAQFLVRYVLFSTTHLTK